ncbi:hypothetical protein [Paraburkholderia jirisanensis]
MASHIEQDEQNDVCNRKAMTSSGNLSGQTERPGNRPRGAPRQAAIAAGAFFLGGGLTFSEIVEATTSLTTIRFDDLFLPAWIALSIIMLTFSIGMGAGKLWAVRLFRWLSFGAMALYVPLLLLALYLNAGPRPIDPGFAPVMFVFAVIKAPCFVIIYRAIRQLRWLDPRSLPHEWEPSALQQR